MIRRRHFIGGAAALAGMATSPNFMRKAAAQQTPKLLKFVPQADLAVIDPLGTTADCHPQPCDDDLRHALRS